MRTSSARSLTILAGLLPLASFLACGRAKPVPGEIRVPNAPVVLISVDTLRSDRLPMYGYT